MNTIRLPRYSSLFAAVLLVGASGFAQIAISPQSTITPNTKAMLDLDFGTGAPAGFLIPRMAFAERPTAPTEALLIYQTNTNPGDATETPGFYYWSVPENAWLRVSNGPGWRLGGNTGVLPTDYLGTTDNQPLVLRTGGTQRLIIQTTGQVQLGEPPLQAATERLDVNGAVRVFGTSAAVATEGAIRWDAATNSHQGYVNNPLGAPQISYVGWYQLENVFKERVNQRFQSVPVLACIYPGPGPLGSGTPVQPSGATQGTWPVFDSNGAAANPSSAATLETPYAMFWEDSRHQYLYQSQDLVNLNICSGPGNDITGIAFQVPNTAFISPLGVRNWRVSMKNTTTSTLNDFDYVGLQLVGSGGGPTPFNPVIGWNVHNFNVSNWQWLGPGWNMLVEFGMDNQDWTSDCAVNYENTAYNGTAGVRCDACGNAFNVSNSTCVWNATTCGGGNAGIPNVLCPTVTSNLAPGSPAAPTPGATYPGAPWNAVGPDATHVQCTGWGHTPGYQLTFAMNGSPTCDCTFQYTALAGVTARRPLLKINAKVNGIGVQYPRGNYMLADKGVMIGDYAGWSNTGASPNQKFKGPGTLSAQQSVWGGSVLLSDHVFDNYYDGRIKAEDAKQARGYKHYPLKEMVNYMEQEHHLPTIAGREDWNQNGSFSVDQLTNQLWVTVETQSLYIKELNDRMEALQKYLVEKRLSELKK